MVESPCIQICHIPPGLEFCIGCGRTRFDITYWLQMSDPEREQVKREAAERLRVCEQAVPTTDPSAK
jgi:uncharacterized protein